jgi:hypothetical protein
MNVHVHGYSGWALTDREGLIDALADAGLVQAHPILDCEHVTYAYPAVDIAPVVSEVRIFGWAANEKVQALVCRVADLMFRPDGNIYHVTFSLAEGAFAVESNEMLWNTGIGWTRIPEISTPVTPFWRKVNQ